MRQRPPRAGTFAPSPRTKLPRKRGSGGVVTMDRPHPYQNGCDLSIGANPRRFFGSFLIAQKATRRRGGEIHPKSNGVVQDRREGQAPPIRVQMGRAARPVVAPYIHRIGRQSGRPKAAPAEMLHHDPSLRGGPQARRGNPYLPYRGNGFPRPLRGLGMTGWAHRVRPQTARQGCRALQARTTQSPPHHGGAPGKARLNG